MNKAAQIATKLEQVEVSEGFKILEQSYEEALHFDVIGEILYVMHDDGSVNIIDDSGGNIITTEVISSANILRVLAHYRPFKEVFKGNTQ